MTITRSWLRSRTTLSFVAAAAYSVDDGTTAEWREWSERALICMWGCLASNNIADPHYTKIITQHLKQLDYTTCRQFAQASPLCHHAATTARFSLRDCSDRQPL